MCWLGKELLNASLWLQALYQTSVQDNQAHFSPLLGEMGGNTGQRCESSRDGGGDGVSFAPSPECGMVLSGLLHGKPSSLSSLSADRMVPCSVDGSRLMFPVGFILDLLLWGLSNLLATAAGKGEHACWDSSESFSGSDDADLQILFFNCWCRVDRFGVEEANGDCIAGESSDGEEATLLLG